MAVIHYESFDGVTAPAVPSGWTFNASLVTTSSPTYSIVPTSSPNVLYLPSTSGASQYFATYGTPDAVGGDVTVYANVAFPPTSHPLSASVVGRGSSSSLGTGSTYYETRFDAFNTQILLVANVSGTTTTLATVSMASYTAGLWYTVAMLLNGATQQVTVQRMTDGYYLNSSGSWVSGYTSAASSSDSSIGGSGHAGLIMVDQASYAYMDDWYFDSLSAPSLPPNRPVIVQVPFGFYPANQF